MTPLEAARLIKDGLDYAVDPCPVCLKDYDHHPDCAVLMLPAIIANLEERERSSRPD